jgi:hypothetical protein
MFCQQGKLLSRFSNFEIFTEQVHESGISGNDHKNEDTTMLAIGVEILSIPNSKAMNADADRDASMW